MNYLLNWHVQFHILLLSLASSVRTTHWLHPILETLKFVS